jgi:mono/diheme cytochrome c family protein
MKFRTSLGYAFALLAGFVADSGLSAQEHPAQRVANIVSVAIEEYAKGIDGNGRLISNDEYQEAVGFLKDARDAAGRLPGDRSNIARAILDSIITAVGAKIPPAAIAPLQTRFAAALGSEAALALPTKPIDLADGEKLYQASCASCHGPRGLGDGPAAANLTPKPPAIGTYAVMGAVTPAMTFRKVSVGVVGTAMPAFASTLTAEQRWNIVAYLGTLRTTPQQVAEGEGLYTQSCVTCHGAVGVGDNPIARGLSKLPPELGSFAWQVERSDSELVRAITVGAPGTPMPPADHLTPLQIQNVAAYLRTLPLRTRTVAIAGQSGVDTVSQPTIAGRSALLLLEQ